MKRQEVQWKLLIKTKLSCPWKYEKVQRGQTQKMGKWVAEVGDTKKKTRAWLGTFNTTEEASLAYDNTFIG